MTFWEWLTVAAVLFGLEVLAPLALFIWLAIAALVLSVLVCLAPIDWRWQMIIFSGVAIAVTFTGRAFLRRASGTTDEPHLNQRNRQYVGRVLTLSEAIENGHGRVRVDDTTWKVRGADLPAGTQVQVTDVDGSVLVVNPVPGLVVSAPDAGDAPTGPP
jgi:inner membrane protein